MYKIIKAPLNLSYYEPLNISIITKSIKNKNRRKTLFILQSANLQNTKIFPSQQNQSWKKKNSIQLSIYND